MLTFADFFSGIGAIRIGFEKAGMKCVFSNEIDKNAIITYETNFKGKVCDKSIEKLDSNEIPNFDVMIAGFPCQSFSIAGQKKGFADDRGNLFFSVVRILHEKLPKAFLLENVKNLKTHDKGKTFATIISELEGIGYTVKYDVLNSCKHGNIPQNRERIFIVGFLDSAKANSFKFPKEITLKKNISDCLESKIDAKYYYSESSKIYPILLETITENVKDNNQVYQYRRKYVRANKSGVCPTLTANMGVGGHNTPLIRDDHGIRKLTPRECLNLQGFPSSYQLPKISDCHLYKQAGNTVCVKIIKKIAKQFAKL